LRRGGRPTDPRRGDRLLPLGSRGRARALREEQLRQPRVGAAALLRRPAPARRNAWRCALVSPRDQALKVIAASAELSALLDEARTLLDDDPGHDLEHCLRVGGWALRCGEARVDPREAIAAALLHDVVNVPKNDPRRAEASALS